MKTRLSSDGYWRTLVLVFILTLPFVNPWVRGDGVEYYAYVRTLMIDGNLSFENEWQASNPTFKMTHLDAEGRVLPQEYTRTGQVANQASVGPSLLWAPFFVVVHGIVLVSNHFGAHIPTDGFSRPYIVSMAFVTSLYGFLGLLLSFFLVRTHFEERWSFLATHAPLKNQCAEFLASITSGARSLSDSRFGMSVVQTLLAIEASMRKHGTAEKV